MKENEETIIPLNTLGDLAHGLCSARYQYRLQHARGLLFVIPLAKDITELYRLFRPHASPFLDSHHDHGASIVLPQVAIVLILESHDRVRP